MFDAWWSILDRGGPVMWPLLGLSVLSLTVAIERLWWFASTSRTSAWQAARRAASAFRKGETGDAEREVRRAGSVFGGFLGDLLEDDQDTSGARLAEAIETHRGRVERFLPTLSTIVTAAPMLGVLGTVLGIIESFELIGGQDAALGPGGMDPRDVGAGIAEALISTAAGLVVALITLVPYVAIRGRAEATVGKLETLAMSIREATPNQPDGPTDEASS
ncbi:MAG: MotA/TolQ/ExbB proton channel family protein [Planctomycetota bacterium]